MTCDDRERFLGADGYPVTLADGIAVNVDDDPDGEDESTHVGVTVEDPGSGAWESVWGIGIPDHWSGMDCREHLWEIAVGGYHDFAERAEWEARDVMTA